MSKNKLSYTDPKSENLTNQNILLVSFKEQTNKNENELLHYGEEQVNQRTVEHDQQLTENREQWSNKVEYMLSVIGYVVDLGSL